jgi:hypothetical protein
MADLRLVPLEDYQNPKVPSTLRLVPIEQPKYAFGDTLGAPAFDEQVPEQGPPVPPPAQAPLPPRRPVEFGGTPEREVQPQQEPSEEPKKPYRPVRAPSAATPSISATDIPGAPSLLAATHLGGDEKDVTQLQKYLNGIKQEEKNRPKTDYSKIYDETKSFSEAYRRDPLGFLQEAGQGIKESTIPMAGAAVSSLVGPAGAVIGGGASFGATSYANNLVAKTRELGGKLDDAKQFNETYLKNKAEIDEHAMKMAGVDTATGAIFGMIPGGGGLKGMVSRLTLAYPSIGVTGEATKRAIEGKPSMTGEEMAKQYAESLASGIPFELAGARSARGREPQQLIPPHFDYEGEVVPPPPQLPPPSGAPKPQEALPAPAAAAPSPGGPVEARGPVTPPAPAAQAPSTKAVDLVKEGASPLQAIEQVGQGADIVNPLDLKKPTISKADVADRLKDAIGSEAADRANQLVDAGVPAKQAQDQTKLDILNKYSDPQQVTALGNSVGLAAAQDAVSRSLPTKVAEPVPSPAISVAPFNAPVVAEPKVAFTTALGSKYVMDANGRTIRDKAPRAEHPGDEGVKQPSDKTVFVDKNNVQAIAPPEDATWRVVDNNNGALSVAVQKPNGSWDVSPSQLNVPYSTIPEVGKHPIELWGAEPGNNNIVGYSKIHPGNAIVSIAQPQPQTQPQESKAGKVDYTAGKEEPKLDVVEGHKYVSMPAPRFMQAIGVDPSVLLSNQQQDQSALPDNAAIKVRLDPSKLQNGATPSEGIAGVKDAIQQVIVSPNAFMRDTGKGEQKKKAVEANSQLQTVLDDLSKNHGVNITYVGQDKTPRAPAGVGNTLVSYARSMGGIKDKGGELRARDLHKVPGVVSDHGVPFDTFADHLILETEHYPGFKAAVNASESNKPTKEMYQRVMDDLGARKSFKEPTNKRVDPTELDHYIENQKTEDAARQSVVEMAQKYNLPTHNDIIDYAAKVMNVNKGISPYDAYLTAHVREANKLGLSDTDLREFIGEDLYNAIARPAQEARAGSGAVVPEGARPANAQAPEGKRPSEPPVSQVSVSAVKPAEVKAEPKAEPGAEGKPQLVIPGADKITEGQLAQRLANKPMQAKVDQKEPDGLFGSGRNQLDLLSMPAEPKAAAVPAVANEPSKPVRVWVEPPKDFGPFKAGVKFSASKNFPSDLAGVAEGWAKMLGIDAPIHMMTFNDAKASNFKGEASLITRSGKDKNAYGTAVYIKTGGKWHFSILIRETGNRVKDLETVAHEIGHVLQKYAFDSADPAVKKKLEDAHKDWKKGFKDKTLGDVLRSRKAPETAKMMLQSGKMDLIPLSHLNPSDKRYALSFEEYFADQVARWAMTSEKPLGVVDKFFKGVGSDLRKLYHGAKKEGAFPNETFKDFIESVTGNVELKQAGAGGNGDAGAFFEREIINPDDEPKLPEPKVEIHRNGVLAQGLVDKFSDLYKIQKAYEKLRGAQLPESMDAYLAQELFNNRVIARQGAVWKDEVQPLLDAMKKEGITSEDFAAFLYARHAPERNEVMRQRDPKRFGADGGSGMTNQAAKDILNKFRAPIEVRVNGVKTRLPSQYDIMERLDRDFVRPIIRKDLNQRLQFGTLTKEQYDQYTRPRTEGGYNHYVPLRGSAEADAAADENIVRSSRNFGVSGKDFKIAFGRESEAFNPLFNVIQQRMEGIVRQEKNKVDNAIGNFVAAHPDNKMARLITNANAPTIKYLAADGTVHERVAFTPQAMETILPFKVNGEQKYLQFDKDNPATVRLVNALKGMPANAVNPVMNGIFQFSRTFSRLNTSLVPDFFLTNFPRDVQDALMTMYGTKKGMAGQFMQDLSGAAKTIFHIETGMPTTEADRALYQEWVDSGGKLNYGGFKDIATVAKDIEKSMKDAFGSDVGLKDRALRAGDKALDTTVAALSMVNDVFEDAVRFAVYRAARKNGYSKERASSLALNSTVNFQTKGAWMPTLNALKPFLSASVGSLRAVYRLAQNSPKRFGQFLSAILMGSIANSLLGVWMSDKDEIDPTKSKYYTNVRGYERQKNFILPYQFADGHYGKIPTGFFYGPIAILGDNIAGVLTGNVKPQEAATNVAMSIYDYANPLGSGTWASQLLFTPIAPFVQHAVNKDWLGRPIYPEETNRTKGLPASEQYGKGTPEWAISTSRFLNSATDGSQFKKGWLDVYPDTLKHYFTFFTGGLGTFTGRSVNAVNNYFENTPTPKEEIPYLRRLMTNTKGIDESNFYDIKNKIQEKENTFRSAVDQYQTDKSPTAKATIIELGKELNMGIKDGKAVSTNSVPAAFKKIQDQNSELKEAIEATRANPKLSPLEKDSRVKRYEGMITSNMLSARKFMQKREPSELTPLQQWFNNPRF